MYQQKKPRDYRSLWIISLGLLVIGILFTFRMSMIRPAGYAMLGIGAIGIIWSLANMDKWKNKKDRDDRRHFN